MTPTREIYWNISGHLLIYVFAFPALLIFGYGIYRRYAQWRQGRNVASERDTGHPLKGLLLYAVLQVRVWREAFVGVYHTLFSWGMVVLFIGTLIVMLEADFRLPVMRGSLYLYFQSLLLDVAGFLALVGILMAGFNRYLIRPERLRNTMADGLLLALLFVILATGFLLEGLRIAATGDPWAVWSPIGWGVAKWFANASSNTQATWHRGLWWFHLITSLAFIAYIPYSKMLHIVTAPLSINNRMPVDKAAAPRPLDVETAETLGAARWQDLSRKDLLELDACTECGRCQDNCPAYQTGKPLSPRTVVLNLRDHVRGSQRVPGTSAAAAQAAVAGEGAGALAGTVVPHEAVWACTTCMSCVAQCPVFINHVPKIVEMRRYQVMEQSEFPETMQSAVRGMEDRGHPFRGTQNSRLDWCRGMDVNTMAEVGSADYLLWVGCAGAFDERNMKITQALARVLTRAGVDFAILGDEEQCTGDAARRMGHEYLFQIAAKQNIETLGQYLFKGIITICPHCHNSLKNDYREFGANYQVYHHSEFLADLIHRGTLRITGEVHQTLTFHDPCYLGRYQGIFQAPRQVLTSVEGINLVEMLSNRNRSFCCGGGGGLYWTEEKTGTRINHARTDQALATGADVICTACPFCMAMLTDGVNAKRSEREVLVKDLAEILDQAT